MDEKKLLGDIKLKEHDKREESITNYMKSLIKKN
jgi:hypothetical protein